MQQLEKYFSELNDKKDKLMKQANAEQKEALNRLDDNIATVKKGVNDFGAQSVSETGQNIGTKSPSFRNKTLRR